MNKTSKFFVIVVIVLSSIALANHLQAQQGVLVQLRDYLFGPTATPSQPQPASPERADIQNRIDQQNEQREILISQGALNRAKNDNEQLRAHVDEQMRRNAADTRAVQATMRNETDIHISGVEGRIGQQRTDAEAQIRISETQRREMGERSKLTVDRLMFEEQKETLRFLEEHEKYLDEVFVERAKFKL